MKSLIAADRHRRLYRRQRPLPASRRRFATDKAIAAAKSKPVMMAEQQLPFDREWSKN